MNPLLTLSHYDASRHLKRLDGRPFGPDLTSTTRRRLAMYTPYGSTSSRLVGIQAQGRIAGGKVDVFAGPGKFYLAGPMRGYPLFNFPAFLMAARILTSRGLTILSPAEKDIEAGLDPSRGLEEQGFDMGAAFRWDMKAVAEADGTILMGGWEKSTGAKIERLVAQMCEREVYILTPDYQLVEASPMAYTLTWDYPAAAAPKPREEIDAGSTSS